MNKKVIFWPCIPASTWLSSGGSGKCWNGMLHETRHGMVQEPRTLQLTFALCAEFRHGCNEYHETIQKTVKFTCGLHFQILAPGTTNTHLPHGPPLTSRMLGQSLPSRGHSERRPCLLNVVRARNFLKLLIIWGVGLSLQSTTLNKH